VRSRTAGCAGCQHGPRHGPELLFAVMFTQVRVGLWKQSFKIYKFRAMRVDADKDGAKWANKNDPRVTSAGPGSDRSRSDARLIASGALVLLGPGVIALLRSAESTS